MKRRRFLQRLLVADLGMQEPAIAQVTNLVVRRRLRFILTFINPLDRSLEGQCFWCYLPASATPTQRLRDVQVSMAHEIQNDVLGHRILALQFDHFPPLAQKVVTVTAEVDLQGTTQPQVLADASTWTAAERFIESDDPRIRALASKLLRPSEMGTVRTIYEWVKAEMTYVGYLAEDLGALQALLYRRGDCTEYADLVVALARANGIPARMVGGYVMDRDLAPRPQDYHNWAEIYLEGAWRLVDSQKGNWLDPIGQYVALRIFRDASTNWVGLAHRYRLKGDLQIIL